MREYYERAVVHQSAREEAKQMVEHLLHDEDSFRNNFSVFGVDGQGREIDQWILRTPFDAPEDSVVIDHEALALQMLKQSPLVRSTNGVELDAVLESLQVLDSQGTGMVSVEELSIALGSMAFLGRIFELLSEDRGGAMLTNVEMEECILWLTSRSPLDLGAAQAEKDPIPSLRYWAFVADLGRITKRVR